MKIFNKYLEEWEKEEIDRLVESELSESKGVEYKRELDLDALKKRDCKKEFLFDIAAFANTEGGVIFFGIDEKQNGESVGIPTKACPIEINNKDNFEERIANIVENNFDPSYTQYKLHFIPYEDKYIIALELQKALGIPRMVTFNKTNKFYKRRSTGKYLVDTFELQNMFSEAIQSRKAVEEWRKRRVTEVRNKEFIPDLDIEGSLFVHILPIQSGNEILDLTNRDKLSELKETVNKEFLSSDSGYNLEGYLLRHSLTNDDNIRLVNRYFQLFRTGSIEYYSTVGLYTSNVQNSKYRRIFGNLLEKEIIVVINISIKILELYGLQFPFVIIVSQFDLMDIQVEHSERHHQMRGQEIKRKELHFPPIVINDKSNDVPMLMKPLFDIFWQSGGYPESMCFDSGEWSWK